MNKFTSLRGTAFLILLFLSSLWFLNFVCRTILSPVLPLIEDEFMISHAKASSIFILLSVGYGISIFFSGLLSGIFGYRKSIVLSLLVTALIFFLIPFVKVFAALYVFTFIIGMATGIYMPAVIPLITSYYDEKIWGKTIAIHDSAASLGVFAVPFIAIFLLRFFQWRWVLGVMGFVFLIIAIIFYLLVHELKVARVTGNVFSKFFKRRALWVLSIIWVFAASTSTGIFYIIPLFLTKELYLDIGYANTIFGISRLGGFVMAIISGFLLNRFSIRSVMVSILIISGVSTAFVAFVGVQYIGIALFFQASFVYGFFPVGIVAISRIFDLNIRGLATGFIFGFGVVFGWGVTPYVLGLSGDHLSFRFGILLLSLATLLSSSLVFLLKELCPEKK
jgi:MFS transporter, NNP family, nitrate/nitrite transporter